MRDSSVVLRFIIFVLLVLCSVVNSRISIAYSQGMAFTYQGRITDSSGNPATGPVNLSINFYAAPTGGSSLLASPFQTNGVALSNGLFSVEINLGTQNTATVFNGQDVWIEITDATHGITFPRQHVTSAPYAVVAGSANRLSANLPASQLSGSVSNSQLANNTVSVIAGTGLTGGGTVPLGGSVTLNVVNPATNALGAMAYQPTNGTIFGFANGYGHLTLNDSPAGNDAQLNFGTNAQIWYNETHSLEAEMQESSWGSWSFTIGEERTGTAVMQLGGTGTYHDLWFMQADTYGVVNAPGHSHALGFSTGIANGSTAYGQLGALAWEQFGMNLSNQFPAFVLYDSFAGYPGMNQSGHLMPISHVALVATSNTVYVNGLTASNTFMRANSTVEATNTYFVDCSGVSQDFVILRAGTSLALVLTNLPALGMTSVKDVTIQAGSNTVAFTVPTNWMTQSSGSLVASAAAPAMIPYGNDLHVHLEIDNIGTAINVYANYLFAYDPPVGDSNVSAFLSASGISGATNLAALNSLVMGLKSAGLWSNWDAIYPLLGTNSGQQAWNLVNPILYNITWTTGSATFDATGFTGDGTASYGDTGFNPATASNPNFVQNSGAFFVYCGTANPAGTGRFMGATSSSGRAAMGMASPASFAADGFNNGDGFNDDIRAAPLASFNTTLMVTRTGSSSESIYAGGLVGGGTQVSTGVPNANVFIGANNFTGVAGGFTPARYAFVGIGGGLTAAQYQTVSNLVYSFELALGRQ